MKTMPSAWKLIIEDDAGKQIVVPFTRDVITVGRKEGNTIRLTERNVSRNHARLSKENGHVVLEDLKSFNGIKLNGDRIDGRVLVHEGDTIQIGDYHLALHAQDGAGANGQSTQKMGPPGSGAPTMKSQAASGGTEADDDFAGDTQRWEPPPGMPGVSVQSLPTVEDRPPITDESTAKAVAVQVKTVEGVPPPELRHGGFGHDGGDTERVTLDVLGTMKAGAPSPARPAREEELEPTVRQVASPPPITLPPAAPVGAALQPTMPVSPVVLTPSPAAAPAPMPANGANGAHGPNGAYASTGNSGTMPIAAAMPAPTAMPPLAQAPAAPAARAPDLRKQQAVLDEQTDMMRPSPGVTEDTSLPRLVVLNTIFAGSTFALRQPEQVLGRTEDNDITIEHKSVSRNHAKVVREGDRVRILDLKSANGVLVNNEEVEAAVLRNGDVIELGRVRMRFVPVGERFVVPPDEIERARLADAAGDDFDNDTGTGVTNPVRQKQKGFQSPPHTSTMPEREQKKPIVLYAGVGVAVVVVLVVLAVVLGGGDKKEDAPPPPPVKADATPPVDDAKPADDVKPIEAKPGEDKPADGNPTPVEAVAVADTPPPDESDEVEAPAGDDRPRPRPRPRPEPKKIDVIAKLGEASRAIAAEDYEGAVRAARDVIDSENATPAQRSLAQTSLKTACKQAGKPIKGCR